MELQKRYPPGAFTIAAATVDPGTAAFDPSPLIPYMKSLGVEYHYIKTEIMDTAGSGSLQGDSICAFCARMKRGALYTCCRENNKNVLVLGQHLDDFAESFMMSAMFNGRLNTMKASYMINQGDLRVIRPLAYTREKETRDFSYAAGLPVINENCPACFEEPKERRHVKKLLAREESMAPKLFQSLCTTLLPLMDEHVQDTVNSTRTHIQTRAHPLNRVGGKDAEQWRERMKKRDNASGRLARRESGSTEPIA